MTQTQMAAELGLSPSYLNLIESNQRPVTVRVLLKLAERFQVELSALAPEDDERLSSHLLEVFSDPLFDGADVKTSDVRDLVSGLPAVAHAIVDLYEALSAPRLGARLERCGRGRERERRGGPAVGGDHRVPAAALNHFPQLEEAAEALWVEHGLAAAHAASGSDQAVVAALRRRCRDRAVRRDARRASPLQSAQSPPRAFRDAGLAEPHLSARPSIGLSRLAQRDRSHRLGRQVPHAGGRCARPLGARQLFRRRAAHALWALSRGRAPDALRHQCAAAPLRRLLRAGLPSFDDAAPARRRRRALPPHPRRHRRQHLEALFRFRDPYRALRRGVPALECL